VSYHTPCHCHVYCRADPEVTVSRTGLLHIANITIQSAKSRHPDSQGISSCCDTLRQVCFASRQKLADRHTTSGSSNVNKALSSRRLSYRDLSSWQNVAGSSAASRDWWWSGDGFNGRSQVTRPPSMAKEDGRLCWLLISSLITPYQQCYVVGTRSDAGNMTSCARPVNMRPEWKENIALCLLNLSLL